MQPSVSIVIPAWNEGETLGPTIHALKQMRDGYRWDELIVVDDGSEDNTFELAFPLADQVIRHSRNRGKGASLETGWRRAKGEIVMFLDADLGPSSAYCYKLLEPVIDRSVDMAIARFPASGRKAGFGLVKTLAVRGIYYLSGFRATAPLSGQRAVRRSVLERVGGLSAGFGVEVGLTIDAARAGFRIEEVPVPFRHRETGRDWEGFRHRGRQFVSVGRTLLHKWRHPVW